MPPGAEFAADERRVVEAHDGGDAVRNHDLAAAFAIQFHFDEPVRRRHASFEMPELPNRGEISVRA